MNLKKKLLIIIAILGIGGIVIFKTIIIKPLLTGKFESLDKIVILSQTSPNWYEDGFTTFELTTKDNKTQAYILYHEVLNSKTRSHYYDHDEYPQNDPCYILKFIYKDKSIDVLQSSENFSLFFRVDTKDSNIWVSGENANLLRVIEEVVTNTIMSK